MEILFSKNIKSSLIKLGLYLNVGGVLGIIIIIWGILKITLLTDLSALVYFIMILFFAYSIFLRSILYEDKEQFIIKFSNKSNAANIWICNNGLYT